MRAINIALMLPDRIVDQSKKIAGSMELTRDRVDIASDVCIPHQTLTMCAVTDEELETLVTRLRAVVDAHGPIPMRSTGVYNVLLDGDTFTSIGIEKSPELMAIYTAVNTVALPYLGRKTESSIFHQPFDESDGYIGGFVENYIYNKGIDGHGFKPHISLGFGEAKVKDVDDAFVSGKLGIFHLGNFGTCRELLVEIDL